MKLIDKVKNLFIEEIEEEKPIKKEVIKVEIPSPEEQKAKEEVKSIETPVVVNETLEPIKKEEKFKEVVFFDDEDFNTLTNIRENKNKTTLKREGYNKGSAPKEEKKIFKPTPIISPIYGILDKNYHKDEIAPKKVTHTSLMYDVDKVTVDDIRNKAYGTLEDELESTLFGKTSIIVEEDKKEKEIDMFDELENEITNFNSELIDSNIEDTMEMDLLRELEAQSEEYSTKDEQVDTELEDNNLDLNEADLFNLIDSMYEKREDD
ncbi:MAG: hypothetical protein PHD10_03485 [Bacilli bacterium]|nr:hypothetical protein [Bacilli bacterium]MDD4608172.1 hypothetical protein [Bacilli bacterium]